MDLPQKQIFETLTIPTLPRSTPKPPEFQVSYAKDIDATLETIKLSPPQPEEVKVKLNEVEAETSQQTYPVAIASADDVVIAPISVTLL
ncbi:hypothetical protein DITRI_Ditri01bG0150100 [Diplodiscus trichospermus]